MIQSGVVRHSALNAPARGSILVCAFFGRRLALACVLLCFSRTPRRSSSPPLSCVPRSPLSLLPPRFSLFPLNPLLPLSPSSRPILCFLGPLRPWPLFSLRGSCCGARTQAPSPHARTLLCFGARTHVTPLACSLLCSLSFVMLCSHFLSFLHPQHALCCGCSLAHRAYACSLPLVLPFPLARGILIPLSPPCSLLPRTPPAVALPLRWLGWGTHPSS